MRWQQRCSSAAPGCHSATVPLPTPAWLCLWAHITAQACVAVKVGLHHYPALALQPVSPSCPGPLRFMCVLSFFVSFGSHAGCIPPSPTFCLLACSLEPDCYPPPRLLLARSLLYVPACSSFRPPYWPADRYMHGTLVFDSMPSVQHSTLQPLLCKVRRSLSCVR